MTIRILLCDTFPGLLPPTIPSYVSMFEKLFRRVSNTVRFEVFRAMDGQLPKCVCDGGIYLITGCNLSVYDDVEWIRHLLEWIRRACVMEVPLVGICFGHQAIAEALGGKVVRHAGGWGAGIRESTVLDEALLPFVPDGRMRLLYNHHDQVARLPEGAVALATSGFCRYEGLRIGRHIVAFQGHPEYTPEYALHLVRNHAAGEPLAVRLAAEQSILTQAHQGESVARFILSYMKNGDDS